jgi:hypothetical protein
LEHGRFFPTAELRVIEKMNARGEHETRGSGGAIVVALMLVLLLPVVYVGSVGPVVKAYNGNLPEGWLMFYAPLVWLDDNVPICRDFFQWYVGLWGVE